MLHQKLDNRCPNCESESFFKLAGDGFYQCSDCGHKMIDGDGPPCPKCGKGIWATNDDCKYSGDWTFTPRKNILRGEFSWSESADGTQYIILLGTSPENRKLVFELLSGPVFFEGEECFDVGEGLLIKCTQNSPGMAGAGEG